MLFIKFLSCTILNSFHTSSLCISQKTKQNKKQVNQMYRLTKAAFMVRINKICGEKLRLTIWESSVSTVWETNNGGLYKQKIFNIQQKDTLEVVCVTCKRLKKVKLLQLKPNAHYNLHTYSFQLQERIREWVWRQSENSGNKTRGLLGKKKKWCMTVYRCWEARK